MPSDGSRPLHLPPIAVGSVTAPLWGSGMAEWPFGMGALGAGFGAFWPICRWSPIYSDILPVSCIAMNVMGRSARAATHEGMHNALVKCMVPILDLALVDTNFDPRSNASTW